MEKYGIFFIPIENKISCTRVKLYLLCEPKKFSLFVKGEKKLENSGCELKKVSKYM